MEQLINTINNPWFFFALAGTFALYLVTLSLVLAIWTLRDIRQRTTSKVSRGLYPLFVLVFGFAGFIPYLALRPRQTFVERLEERRERMLLVEAAKKFECPTCFAPVQGDFAFCPSCRVEFKPVCSCTAVLDVTWKRCPYCGVSVSSELKAKKYAVPLIAEELRGAYLGDTGDIKKIEAVAKKVAKTKWKNKFSKKDKAGDKAPVKVPALVAKPEFVISAPKSAPAQKPPASVAKPTVKPVAPVVAKSTAKPAKAKPEREVKLTGFSSLFRRAFAIKR